MRARLNLYPAQPIPMLDTSEMANSANVMRVKILLTDEVFRVVVEMTFISDLASV